MLGAKVITWLKFDIEMRIKLGLELFGTIITFDPGF